MLPVSVYARQARATHVLRLLPPSRRHLDRIHALTHQFSQRVTPARDRMTFRHNSNDEARTVPLGDVWSSDCLSSHLSFVGEGGRC